MKAVTINQFAIFHSELRKARSTIIRSLSTVGARAWLRGCVRLVACRRLLTMLKKLTRLPQARHEAPPARRDAGRGAAARPGSRVCVWAGVRVRGGQVVATSAATRRRSASYPLASTHVAFFLDDISMIALVLLTQPFSFSGRVIGRALRRRSPRNKNEDPQPPPPCGTCARGLGQVRRFVLRIGIE